MSFSIWGIPGALAALVAWSAAVVVFRTGPHRSLNRRLAALLVLEGMWLNASVGALFFLESAEAVHAVSIAGTACTAALPFAYLAFLGIALDTPLVRPFRSRRAFFLLSGAAALAGASVVAWPDLFVGPAYAPGWAPWNFRLVSLGQSAALLQGAVYLFGFLAALAAYTSARHRGGMRRQAKWFAFAFGARDAYIGVTQLLYPVLRPVEFWGDLVYNPGLGGTYVVYVALLSYGVLQAQLFDLNLKIKVALRRSTVVAVVAGAFFVGSEVLESVIPVDGTLLGVVTAGLIVLLLRPVQHVAERIVRRLMPGVEPTPEYLEARKLEVYRAAVESAFQDGRVTERERRILARLRTELEIREEEAVDVERDVEDRSGEIARGPGDAGDPGPAGDPSVESSTTPP